ncbi:Pentatricopeptide repeat-containing protein At3g25210, mitochondrial [Linum perenne]
MSVMLRHFLGSFSTSCRIPSLPIFPLLRQRLVYSSSDADTQIPDSWDSDVDIPHLPRTRTRTPLESGFETWTQKLKPGFTPADVEGAIRAQTDPDLALDIFRWTAQQRNYKHNHVTYLTMIKTLINGRRYRHAETLVEEVIAGACEMTVPLYNSVIRFCCGRKFLFNRAFDVYKKMLKSDDCKPTLETYALLFNSLLRRFNKLNVCYVYLHAVKSMTKQGLYGCEPNGYSYGYLVKGLFEKGRLIQGLGFYREMKSKGLVPGGSTYMIVICSLAMARKLDDAVGIVFDMLKNSLSPDQLTYKTLLEGMCRDGRGSESLELLEQWRKMDGLMGEKVYKALLNETHFLSRD